MLALGILADSMGLADRIDELRNPGPISHFALAELERLEIVPQAAERYPRKAYLGELSTFHRSIALSEKEHLPMVQQQFPHMPMEKAGQWK